jgi:hypothetical protein
MSFRLRVASCRFQRRVFLAISSSALRWAPAHGEDLRRGLGFGRLGREGDRTRPLAEERTAKEDMKTGGRAMRRKWSGRRLIQRERSDELTKKRWRKPTPDHQKRNLGIEFSQFDSEETKIIAVNAIGGGSPRK